MLYSAYGCLGYSIFKHSITVSSIPHKADHLDTLNTANVPGPTYKKAIKYAYRYADLLYKLI
jgi:hypothetical protein